MNEVVVKRYRSTPFLKDVFAFMMFRIRYEDSIVNRFLNTVGPRRSGRATRIRNISLPAHPTGIRTGSERISFFQPYRDQNSLRKKRLSFFRSKSIRGFHLKIGSQFANSNRYPDPGQNLVRKNRSAILIQMSCGLSDQRVSQPHNPCTNF